MTRLYTQDHIDEAKVPSDFTLRTHTSGRCKSWVEPGSRCSKEADLENSTSPRNNGSAMLRKSWGVRKRIGSISMAKAEPSFFRICPEIRRQQMFGPRKTAFKKAKRKSRCYLTAPILLGTRRVLIFRSCSIWCSGWSMTCHDGQG